MRLMADDEKAEYMRDMTSEWILTKIFIANELDAIGWFIM